jgi:phage/conjugal plasmid C-4 type zinc finger TraR family protein
MDIYDQATELEELQREIAIAETRARASHGDAATSCAACGEEISAERRAAAPGCVRCVECQERSERDVKERAR